MAKIRIKYDKQLKKYHIEYHKDVHKHVYRFDTYIKMNHLYDLYCVIETHLGSVTSPEPLAYTKEIETFLGRLGIRYQVRPMEVREVKPLFGFLGGKKKPMTDYSITFVVPKDQMTKELFDQVFCEFDLQIGYQLLVEEDQFFTDLLKGYVDSVQNTEYFKEHFFDSRIFDKFLSSEDINIL